MSFSAIFFEGLGWAPLVSGVESETFLTMGTFMWLPLAKIFVICSAVFTFYSLKAILAFHKYYITSLTPVFHTGSLRVKEGGVDPMELSLWGIVPFLTTRCPSLRFYFKGLRWATLGSGVTPSMPGTSGVIIPIC